MADGLGAGGVGAVSAVPASRAMISILFTLAKRRRTRREPETGTVFNDEALRAIVSAAVAEEREAIIAMLRAMLDAGDEPIDSFAAVTEIVQRIRARGGA